MWSWNVNQQFDPAWFRSCTGHVDRLAVRPVLRRKRLSQEHGGSVFLILYDIIEGRVPAVSRSVSGERVHPAASSHSPLRVPPLEA
jgi:hypothetical protein